MTNEEIEKFQQYAAWLDYQIGFSGMGTTALDIEPSFPIPTDIPDEVKLGMIETGKEYAFAKWRAWCKASADLDDYAIEEYCQSQGVAVIRLDNYASDFETILKLYTEAQKDFIIKPNAVKLVQYGGNDYRGTFGIEFPVNGQIISSQYERIGKLEYHL